MISSIPECDTRMVEHLVRLAGAERKGRIWEAVGATHAAHQRGGAAVVAPVRRWLGETLVGIGARLSGTPASHAAEPAES